MNCKNCGNGVQENWKMCPFCGSQIEKKKLCAKCGAELQPNWAMCPFCGEQAGASFVQTTSTVDDSILPSLDDILPSDSDLDLVADDILEAKQREQEQANAAYQKKLSLARIACIRENFEQANGIYEQLIADNPEDINAYIGFVRIESQNYTQYQGTSIEKAIRVVEQIGRDIEVDKLDKEYKAYLEKRNAELVKIAAVKEAEQKAKTEAECKANEEAELKADADTDNFNIENGVLVKYIGKGGDVTIPNSVTSIGNRAFFDCEGLTRIIIPNSVTSIGSEAFWSCESLKSITIPDGVKRILKETFALCKRLTSVTIPNSVTSIGKEAFKSCPLQTVSVSKNCKVDENAFNSTCEVIYR